MKTRFSPKFQEFSSNNPAPTIVLETTIKVESLKGMATVELTYVPDASIVSQVDFNQWIKSASTTSWKSWENLGEKLLDGFYDAVLPQKMCVNLQVNESQSIRHKVTFAKSQPNK